MKKNEIKCPQDIYKMDCKDCPRYGNCSIQTIKETSIFQKYWVFTNSSSNKNFDMFILKNQIYYK